MSFLYYENLDERLSERDVKSIMWTTLHGIKPYFRFIDRIMYTSRVKRIYITVERFEVEDLMTEEFYLLEDYTTENDLYLGGYDKKEIKRKKRLKKQLDRVTKLSTNGRGVLYKCIEPQNSEGLETYQHKKEQFLNSKEVFPTKHLENPRSIKVLATYPPYDILVLKKEDINNKRNRMRLYLRPNLYQLDVINQSLEQLLNRPLKHNRNLIRLFENIRTVKFDDVIPHPIRNNEWLFLTDDLRSGNVDQREFVKIALGTPDLAILEGPPGSGKTTTICELIYQALKRDLKILLVASTHVAVDNVIEKLMDEDSDVYEKVKQYVLPIRIGKTDRISDLATEYQLDSFWETEKEKLRKNLRSIKNKTESQDMMLGILESDEKTTPDYMKRVFVRAANLVCGTTIGILKHPEIEKLRFEGKTASMRPYDILILDEASKTTFQEFLVPALIAERHIIVGDIKQLPPYVDEDGVVSNIITFAPEEGNIIALVNNFEEIQKINKNHTIKCLKLLAKPLHNDELLEKLIPSTIPYYVLSDLNKMEFYNLLGASIIFGTKADFEKNEEFLPLSINSYVEHDASSLQPIELSSLYDDLRRWKRKIRMVLKENYEINLKISNDQTWSEAIGWRLVRDYELRSLVDNRYKKQIEKLIPNHWSDIRRTKFLSDLDQVKRLAFPSIIELLQKGFERSQSQKEKDIGLIITDGLPVKNVMKHRHKILRFQHRMHPSISSFPREFFYDNEALQDPQYISEERQFEYPNYKNRIVWIDIRLSNREINQSHKNSNSKEANAIIKEIKDLLMWTSDNRRKDNKPWKIAILPFYLSQENLIRKKLQSYLKSRRTRTFYLPEKNVVIELCAVDRFQGHEADIVYLSLVRSRGLGFLDTPNRLNVALTRAKYQLVIVGNKKLFKEIQKRSEILQQLAERVESKKIW